MKMTLQDARKAVANDWRRIKHAIRTEDAYASHVTEQTKDRLLSEGLATANAIERGELDYQFWCWQRLNEKITGECVALLPNT